MHRNVGECCPVVERPVRFWMDAVLDGCCKSTLLHVAISPRARSSVKDSESWKQARSEDHHVVTRVSSITPASEKGNSG